MHNEASEDLLVYISMQEDEPEAARQAFHEFHRRFKKYVWEVSVTLSRCISDPNRDILAKDIFGNTFQDVFANYRSKAYFDPRKCQDMEKGIKVWLSGIAKNHLKRLIDAARAASSVSYLDTFPERPFFDTYDPKEEMADSPRMVVLKRALEHLSDKEREILLISVQFEEQGGMPEEIKRSLCATYGVLPDSLRQIKKRAKEKIENYMREHDQFIHAKFKINVR